MGIHDIRGSALFLVLIAVVLFAGLSYAVTISTRSAGNIDKEKADMAAALSEQCSGYVERAVNTLKLLYKCPDNQISYELANGYNPNPLAPPDKSCHVFDPSGAGASPCGAYLGSGACVLTDLALGEKCVDADIVYAGDSGGNRIYTTSADSGTMTWNNGTTNSLLTGATSTSDGKANTDILVSLADAGAPYAAANLCRGIGPEWYLPARDEFNRLYLSMDEGVLNGTFNESGGSASQYWTSSQNAADLRARQQRVTDGFQSTEQKNATRAVRCTRRD